MAAHKKMKTRVSQRKPVRKAILVAGMHRSGTSALTRLMGLMGADLPKTLMPASKNNEAGFWESTVIYRLNEEILASAGSSWNDWSSFNEKWYESDTAKSFEDQALNVLADELGNSRLFVLKDPRFCILLKFWVRVLLKFGAEPVLACPVRNPYEVAASLNKRNIYLHSFSYLLWLRNMLDVEYFSRGIPRIYTNYDVLLNDWQTFREQSKRILQVSWPRLTNDRMHEINAFLNHNLRHHAVKPETILNDKTLSLWLRSAYSIFNRWGLEGESSSDQRKLDAIKQKFNESVPAFAELVNFYIEKKQDIVNLQKSIDAIGNELKASKEEIQIRTVKLKNTRLVLEERTKELANLESQVSMNTAKLQVIQEDLINKTRELIQRDTEAKAASAMIGVFQNRLVQEKVKHEELIQQIDTLRLNLVKKDELVTDLGNKLSETEHKLSESKYKLSETEHKLSESKYKLSETEHKLSESEKKKKNYSVQVKVQQVENSKLKKELNQIRSSPGWKLMRLSGFPVRKIAETYISYRNRNYIKLIATSGLFDTAWYLSKYPDVLASGMDPVKHFILYGAGEGRNPGPGFDTKSYINKHSDVEESGVNPLVHYILHRTPSNRYLNPLHLITYPFKNFRHSVNKFLLQDQIALVALSDIFNRDWYLTRYPDVKAAGIDPAEHYVLYGGKEGRDPGPKFSTNWYLSRYRDVAKFGMNSLVHYLMYGIHEDREISPSDLSDRRKPGTTKALKPTLGIKPSVAIKLDKMTVTTPAAAAIPVSFAQPETREIVWIHQADLVARNGFSTIRLAGLRLGLVQDAESQGNASTGSLYQMFRVIKAFCRVMCLNSGSLLDADNRANDTGGQNYLNTRTDTEATRGISLPRTGHAGSIADIWYIDDFHLRIRFDPITTGAVVPFVARFFQYNLYGSGSLILSAESALGGDCIDFVDVRLLNPYFPLLVCFSTTDGLLLSATILPFPSLCRNGVHYSELCALAGKTSYIERLWMSSESQLNAMLDDQAGAPGLSIGRIEIDLDGATGTEPVFRTGFREWLAGIMHVELHHDMLANTGHAKVRACLVNALAVSQRPAGIATDVVNPVRGDECPFKLVLRASAVPALQALTSRHITMPENITAQACSYTVTDNLSLKPAWYVTAALMGGELLDLQPAGAGTEFPLLKRLSETRPITVSDAAVTFPLAIRFCETRDRHEAAMLMPIAPCIPGPLLNTVYTDRSINNPAISVVLPDCGKDTGLLAAFLASLRTQTVADSVDIIAVSGAGVDAGKILNRLLDGYFPEKYSVISDRHASGINNRINLAADKSKGEYILIARENIVLHDPRTLETLCLIAGKDKVASAGCVLIKEIERKKKRELVFHSGGFFVSVNDASDLCCSETDCYSVFPCATYPVAGNTSKLFMVRSEVWRALGGFDGGKYPDKFGDIDYGCRAMEIGLRHFCTSVMTAGLHRINESHDAVYEGVLLSGLRPGISCEKILLSAGSLKVLRG